MKLIIILALCALPIKAQPQSILTNPIRHVASDPGTCPAGSKIFNTTAALFKSCLTSNIWTVEGTGTFTVKTDNVAVGSPRSIINLFSGAGINVVGVDTGTQINLTPNVDTAFILSRPTHQAGTSTYCRSTTGNDSYACALNPTLTAYTRGGCLTLDADTGNTLTATINVDVQGLKSILNRAGAALATGDITANKPIQVCYDGTQFIIQGDGGGGGFGAGFGFDPMDRTKHGMYEWVLDSNGLPYGYASFMQAFGGCTFSDFTTSAWPAPTHSNTTSASGDWCYLVSAARHNSPTDPKVPWWFQPFSGFGGVRTVGGAGTGCPSPYTGTGCPTLKFGGFTAINTATPDFVGIEYDPAVGAGWQCTIRTSSVNARVPIGVNNVDSTWFSLGLSSTATGTLSCSVTTSAGVTTTVSNVSTFPSAVVWWGAQSRNNSAVATKMGSSDFRWQWTGITGR